MCELSYQNSLQLWDWCFADKYTHWNYWCAMFLLQWLPYKIETLVCIFHQSKVYNKHIIKSNTVITSVKRKHVAIHKTNTLVDNSVDIIIQFQRSAAQQIQPAIPSCSSAGHWLPTIWTIDEKVSAFGKYLADWLFQEVTYCCQKLRHGKEQDIVQYKSLTSTTLLSLHSRLLKNFETS